ncbi:alpha/beta hydrolase [Thalassotalea mangrovi]|uniref:Alpha/beta hydrolase n=1 Tax=Thalassotalea mangrovi TaxID=2572245 RepID=A0A4U1B223_9GAMM|nr:alpha/beta hydrolase-fold protein [Thalassotalea mangrovi]TKB43518.1 alpha/beta hydrolase [Thalassotalea mangrovi]
MTFKKATSVAFFIEKFKGSELLKINNSDPLDLLVQLRCYKPMKINMLLSMNLKTPLLALLVWLSLISPFSLVTAAPANVVIEQNAVTLPSLDRSRTIRVYLPPSYHQSDKRYPVLYMHDAQNLFDDKTSYAGEWGIDESLDNLAKTTGFEAIVVGIDNHPEYRLNEYSPWTHEKYGVGEGKKFVADLVSTLKPYIDQHYRTNSDKANTAIFGSSLGAFISHYALLAYPETFSRAGLFSPSYWYSDKVWTFTEKHAAKINNSQVYLLVGGQEGESMVPDMMKMAELLRTSLPDSSTVQAKVVKAGKHNEGFWRSEFAEAIIWLYGLETDSKISGD